MKGSSNQKVLKFGLLGQANSSVIEQILVTSEVCLIIETDVNVALL
jgi:hypothetical protein